MQKLQKLQRLLIVGCGDVALRALPRLTRRYRVYALLRAPDATLLERLRRLGVTPLSGDLDQPLSLRRLAGLADAVLHCAPPPNQARRIHAPLICLPHCAIHARLRVYHADWSTSAPAGCMVIVAGHPLTRRDRCILPRRAHVAGSMRKSVCVNGDVPQRLRG